MVLVLIWLNLAYSFLQRYKRGLNLPNKVFGCDDCGGYGIAKCMELDGVMRLQELLAQEYIEVGVPFVRDIDLVGSFRTSGGFAGLVSGGIVFHI